jgi:hypothetical protein
MEGKKNRLEDLRIWIQVRTGHFDLRNAVLDSASLRFVDMSTVEAGIGSNGVAETSGLTYEMPEFGDCNEEPGLR